MAQKRQNRMSYHSRRSFTPLSDIPEGSPLPTPTPPRPEPARRVTPGPNAFAQQAAKVDKHRLQSNAFYQQEVMRRAATPPTAIHPAFREGFDINAPNVRHSGYTTMSPFIDSTGQTQTPPTPPILLPKDCFQAYPTDRGFIEDRREHLQHENSGSDTERTPVFIPTPKVASNEFIRSNSRYTPRKVSVRDQVDAIEQPKTPKKTFLEKLGFSTPRSSQVASSNSSLGTSRGYGVFGGGEILPPKAKAVLSDSPHKSSLTRTPSKKKGLFSFKSSDRPSLETRKSSPAYTPTTAEPRSAGARTVSFADSTVKTPPTAHTSSSDPIYNREYVRHMQAQRALSQPGTDKAGRKIQNQNKEGSASGVSRTRSLQYIDRTMPPTPPAKNTPPHEKEQRTQREARLGAESRAILEHHRFVSEQRRLEVMRNMTPKKEMVQTPESKTKSSLHQGIFNDDTPTHESAKLVGTDARTSPTKTGGYGRKELPKLVKQPSVYSMHASFYPDLHDQYSFEEMKKRADGLGLEGLSKLPESFYNCDPQVSYSPSLYSEDFVPRPSGIQTSPSTLHQMDIAQHTPSPLAIHEKFRPFPNKGSLSEKPSASSQGTIPLVYPDLASDPSRSDLREGFQKHHRSTSEIQLPVHSRNQSPARSQSHPRGQSQSPSHSRSPHKPALEVITKALEEENASLSPPTYSCPSAKPSPLHFLPNTIYSPQRGLKLDVEVGPESPSSASTKTLTPSRSRGRIETFKSTGSPIARFSTSPFDKLPTLSPSIKPKLDTLSPTTESNEQPEPQKQDHSSFSDSNTTVPAEDQNDQEDQPQQVMLGPETHQQSLNRKLQEQHAEIARLQAEAAVFRKKISQTEQEREQLDAHIKATRTKSIPDQIHEQLAEIAKAKAEAKAFSQRISRFQAHFEEKYKYKWGHYMQSGHYIESAADSNVDNAMTPGLSSAVDSDADNASSIADTSISELAGESESEAFPQFIEEPGLTQMGLYHRTSQQRVDQEYDAAQFAELQRHERSDSAREPKKKGPSREAMLGMFELLAESVKELQITKQDK